MKKSKRSTKKSKLVELMSNTVFLNEPDISLPPREQFDEDLNTIAKWMVTHRNKIVGIL